MELVQEYLKPSLTDLILELLQRDMQKLVEEFTFRPNTPDNQRKLTESINRYTEQYGLDYITVNVNLGAPNGRS